MEITPRDYLEFKARLYFTQLFKTLLGILEDVDHHYKLSENDFEYYRKKILDSGNDKIREFREELENIYGNQVDN